MPTVLQINSCIKGSTGSIAQNIGNMAISHGWDSWIAYSAREPKSYSNSNIIQIGSCFESQIHALKTRLFDLHGFGSRHATKNFVKTIQEIHPDIIHLHNIHGYYINIEVLFNYLAKTDVPIVWTLHDCWAFTGHCVHFTDVDCNKWIYDLNKGNNLYCNHCPKKKGYPSSLFWDRSRINYNKKCSLFTSPKNLTIVPVSHWLGSVVEKSFLNKYPIHVIQNGIDTNTFSPRVSAVERLREQYHLYDKFVIIGVAKGWSNDVGLDIFYKLRKQLSDNYAIIMVGLSKKQMSKLPSGIIGIPHTEPSELAELYSVADVLFNGSYQETFGLVTAEAMACGTPAIVYNSTACPEIVDNERGRIIPVGNFDKLIEAIKSLYILPQQEKTNMSIQCTKFVNDKLKKEIKYQEYIHLYNSLL